MELTCKQAKSHVDQRYDEMPKGAEVCRPMVATGVLVGLLGQQTPFLLEAGSASVPLLRKSDTSTRPGTRREIEIPGLPDGCMKTDVAV
jgi:hypothetical protein